MMKQKFSVLVRLKSFKYAFTGIAYLFRTQSNAWIHSAAAIGAVALGFILYISLFEWLAVCFAIGFVFAAETFNTAIEKLADLASPEWNEKTGRIKDISAGAVLVAAITALVIGLIVFLPKI